jgi:hypothetical protein
MTPLHCGSHQLGYRSSQEYARDVRHVGISLGAALAISGATSDPNKGYNSSPVLTTLMTLFGLRLGQWLGNPGPAGHDSFKSSAPRSTILNVMGDVFGLSNENSRYVYLSDGGHFDNLGLYEMVLRRCHLIVVSDAGCNPAHTLEDLNHARDRIRASLGVEILLKDLDEHCIIGDIDYSAVDGMMSKSGNAHGLLFYVRASSCYVGGDSQNISGISDQVFSGSQFEHYRVMGEALIKKVLSGPSEMFGFRRSTQNH